MAKPPPTPRCTPFLILVGAFGLLLLATGVLHSASARQYFRNPCDFQIAHVKITWIVELLLFKISVNVSFGHVPLLIAEKSTVRT